MVGNYIYDNHTVAWMWKCDTVSYEGAYEGTMDGAAQRITEWMKITELLLEGQVKNCKCL